MLPFNEQKKTYQCFVCGKEKEDLSSLKEHILKYHEKGREYLLCPLERCQSCVRDLSLHFKVKHPDDILPPDIQTRVLIWKDHKRRRKKVSFKSGDLISIKNKGKKIHYRSGMELEIFKCLEIIPEVLSYHVEPFKDGIFYLFEGKEHHYHPDLLIQYKDSFEVWEIKPKSQTKLEVNEAKWGAAKVFCESRGYNFIVMTEQGLERLKKVASRVN